MIIDTSNIKKLVNACKSLDVKRNTMPSLDRARIDVGKKITATVTDLEHTLIVHIGHNDNADKIKSFCIKINNLPNLIGGSWAIDDKKLKMSNGESTQEVGIFSIDEYPTTLSPSKVDATGHNTVSKDALKWLELATSKDKTRYNIDGVAFDAESNKIVATDGHRMHIVSAENLEVSGICQYKAIRALLAFGSQVAFSHSKDYFVATFADGKLISRKVDGAYPDYKQVIPIGYSDNIISFTKENLKTLKSLASVTTDKYKTMKIVLNRHCEFYCSSPEKGSKSCKHTHYRKDKDAVVGISIKYLLSALSWNPNASLYIGEPLDPMRLLSADGEAIIMPMLVE